MAFIIPPYTSATLGVGFPAHGTFATPFVVTAPNLFKSTNSENSSPEPKVPEATVTGFFHSTPAMFTLISTELCFSVFIRFPPPLIRIPVHPYRPVCCVHCCDHLFLCSYIHRQDMLRFHMPFSLPMKCNTQSHFPRRKL